jgi:hypothetical protein
MGGGRDRHGLAPGVDAGPPQAGEHVGKPTGVHRAHVEQDRGGAAGAQPGLDGARDLVTRRQLVHEPLAAGVVQGRTLAADRLGDQEAVGAVRPRPHDRGGMELHQLEVGQRGAGGMADEQPAPHGARRIGRARPKCRGASRGQHGRPGGHRVSVVAHQSDAAAVDRPQGACPAALEHGYPRVLGDQRRQLAGDPPSRRASPRVRDPAYRVATLESQGEPPLAIGVEVHAEPLQVAHPAGRLGAQHLGR